MLGVPFCAIQYRGFPKPLCSFSQQLFLTLPSLSSLLVLRFLFFQWFFAQLLLPLLFSLLFALLCCLCALHGYDLHESDLCVRVHDRVSDLHDHVRVYLCEHYLLSALRAFLLQGLLALLLFSQAALRSAFFEGVIFLFQTLPLRPLFSFQCGLASLQLPYLFFFQPFYITFFAFDTMYILSWKILMSLPLTLVTCSRFAALWPTCSLFWPRTVMSFPFTSIFVSPIILAFRGCFAPARL